MPVVSIIIPCFNEETTITLLLDAVNHQTFPLDQMEIIVVDGLSTDHTRQKISDYHLTHPNIDIKVVDNPKRNIPSALNQGIAVSTGEYIIRLDAHSIPYPDYIEQCVSALTGGKGENVGGIWEIKPGGLSKATWISRGIAAAAAHPLGVGDALYRHTKNAQFVDTVPFGAFHRNIFNQIGYFDESLLTNEDYEFNVRIRSSGGRIWLDPAIRSIYIARSSFRELIRQYWRYGFWKGRMLLRYPTTLRWRQAIPPLFVAGLLLLLVSTPWFAITRWILLLLIIAYLTALILASIQTTFSKGDWSIMFSFPLAITIMHFFWGAGVLWSLFRALFKSAKAVETVS